MRTIGMLGRANILKIVKTFELTQKSQYNPSQFRIHIHTFKTIYKRPKKHPHSPKNPFQSPSITALTCTAHTIDTRRTHDIVAPMEVLCRQIDALTPDSQLRVDAIEKEAVARRER
jgi:hypothetical protein